MKLCRSNCAWSELLRDSLEHLQCESWSITKNAVQATFLIYHMTPLRIFEAVLQEPSVQSRLFNALYGDSEDVVSKNLVAITQSEISISKPDLLRTQVPKWCQRDVRGICKDATHARDLKQCGAGHFGQKHYLQAAKAYSQAIQHAPIWHADDRFIVSKLYSNRALCHSKLGSGVISQVCT